MEVLKKAEAFEKQSEIQSAKLKNCVLVYSGAENNKITTVLSLLNLRDRTRGLIPRKIPENCLED